MSMFNKGAVAFLKSITAVFMLGMVFNVAWAIAYTGACEKRDYVGKADCACKDKTEWCLYEKIRRSMSLSECDTACSSRGGVERFTSYRLDTR